MRVDDPPEEAPPAAPEEDLWANVMLRWLSQIEPPAAPPAPEPEAPPEPLAPGPPDPWLFG